MPRMLLCGRRVNMSSDDFACPSITGIILRCSWLTLSIVLLISITRVAASCLHTLTAFLAASLFIVVACGLFLDAALALVSARGTMLDDAPRARVPALATARIVCSCAELLLMAFGVASAAYAMQRPRSEGGCGGADATSTAVLAFAVMGVILTSTVVVAVATLLICATVHEQQQRARSESDEFVHSSRRWARRCRACACVCRGADAHTQAFEVVGAVMASVFRSIEVVGLSASDILAGLALLRAVHKEEQADAVAHLRAQPHSRRSSALRVRTMIGSPLASDDATLLLHAAHYSAFALGAYGWPIYAYMNTCTCCLRLPCGACVHACRDARVLCERAPTVAARRAHPWTRAHYTHMHSATHTSGCGRIGLTSADVCGCNETAMRMMLKHAMTSNPSESQVARALMEHLDGAATGQPRCEHTRIPLPADVSASAAAARSSMTWSFDRVLHTSHTNAFFTCPWYVAVDSATQSLIICVRGTLSLEDCITDAHAVPLDVTSDVRAVVDSLRLPPPLETTRYHVHAGMWACATEIEAQISRLGLLEAARVDAAGADGVHVTTDRQGDVPFGDRTSPFLASPPAEAATCACADALPGPTADAVAAVHMRTAPCGATICTPTLRIVCVGHSLGAGVAALLGLKLAATHASTRVYAFAPPGALVCTHTAEVMTHMCVSLAIGNDCVPRMSLPSLTECMSELVEVCARARVSKPALLHALACSRAVVPSTQLLHPASHTLPDCAFTRALSALRAASRELVPSARDVIGDARALHRMRMFVPGRIMHMVKVGAVHTGLCASLSRWCGGDVWTALCSLLPRDICACFCGRTRNVYVPRWTTRDALTRIIVSPSMVADHMPDKMMFTLQEAVQDWVDGALDVAGGDTIGVHVDDVPISAAVPDAV